MLATILLAVVAVVSTMSNGVHSEQLKVMSFNVRTSVANDSCPAGCWEQRKTRAQAVLAKYEPDLVGTQETAPEQTAWFEDSLGYTGVGECAGLCEYNERNSIFFRGDKWDVLATETFALSDTPEEIGSNTWNLEYLRAGVLGRFLNKRSGDVVCMLNTHYDITRGQNQSSVLVAERIADFCEPFDTVVMTGDLNTAPESAAVQYLLGEQELQETVTPIPMYEALTAAGAGGNTWIGSSFGNRTVWNKIDYIFARQDAQTCLQSGEIITETFEGGFTSSDHALVMSTFCIGEMGCVDCLN